MKKKLLIGISIILMAMLFVACGNNSTQQGDDGDTKANGNTETQVLAEVSDMPGEKSDKPKDETDVKDEKDKSNSEANEKAPEIPNKPEKNKPTEKPKEEYITLTFDLGYDGLTLSPRKLKAWETFGQLPVPFRDGYRFISWVDKNGILWYSDSSVDCDLALYASWEEYDEDWLMITSHPYNVENAQSGEWAEFSIDVFSNLHEIRYLWEYSKDGKVFVEFSANDNAWATGWNTKLLEVNTENVENMLYVRCLAYSGNYSEYSSAVTLTVNRSQ